MKIHLHIHREKKFACGMGYNQHRPHITFTEYTLNEPLFVKALDQIDCQNCINTKQYKNIMAQKDAKNI